MPISKPLPGTPLNWAHPLNRGLVSDWPFWEGAGGKAYDIVGGNAGTLTNGAAWTGGRAGGSSLLFNNAGYVDVGNSTMLNPPAMSIAAWVKGTTFPNAYNAVMGREQTSGPLFYMLAVKSTGKLACYISGSATVSYDGTGAITLLANQWYHLVMTYSAALGLTGYVNGVVDGSAAANGNLATITDTTYIGTHRPASYTRYFNGAIDQPCLYNRVLTPQDVQADYSQSSNRFAEAA